MNCIPTSSPKAQATVQSWPTRTMFPANEGKGVKGKGVRKRGQVLQGVIAQEKQEKQEEKEGKGVRSCNQKEKGS